MSLVGFNITNHPQQVAKRGASDTVDERITPQWLFAEYDLMYHFTIDAAANGTNTKCDRFHSLQTDGLAQSWAGERVWCNPPYSNIKAWVAKAYKETLEGSCELVVMLLPANRTEQAWWQTFIEPMRDAPDHTFIRTRFLAKRINFGVPGNEGAKFNSSPPFGLVVVTFRGTN
jgi:phage N-6-adenine-methyltransferase